MIMEDVSRKSFPPPPGLIASFAAGFELTANHVAVILLPILLDLFLWLGPHLQVKQIINPMMKQVLAAMSGAAGLPGSTVGAADLAFFQKIMQMTLDRFNVFAALQTMPVGVPSLLAGSMPVIASSGAASALPAVDFGMYPLLWMARLSAGWMLITNSGYHFLLWIGLTILGWVLGTVYYQWVANLSQANTPEKPVSVFLRSALQSIMLLLGLGVALVVLGLPAMLVLSVLTFAIPQIAVTFLLVVFFVFLWVLPFIFFIPHGIFAFGQNFLVSIKSSFTLTRYTLSASGLFIMLMFVFSAGFNALWSMPSINSWLALVGIVGHAFIATALLASSFVYYRNVFAWIQLVLEYRKQATPLRA